MRPGEGDAWGVCFFSPPPEQFSAFPDCEPHQHNQSPTAPKRNKRAKLLPCSQLVTLLALLARSKGARAPKLFV